MNQEAGIKETILVTGSSGFLGNSIIKMLQHQYEIIGVSRAETNINFFQCDLTNDEKVSELAELISPNIIIHAAGLKDIQFCEDNPKLAHLINVRMVRNISNYFPNTKIIYISTDYVFRGDTGMYMEKDTPNPITIYGETKYKGELVGLKNAGKNFKIIRTASVYSDNSSFIKFLEMNITNNNPIESYTDCIFSPTYICDLVASIKKIIENNFTHDIFHVVGDAISRYSFAKSYFEAGNYDLHNLLKGKNNGKNIYLYKDLSLNSLFTKNILELQSTVTEDAFRDIIKGYPK